MTYKYFITSDTLYNHNNTNQFRLMAFSNDLFGKNLTKKCVKRAKWKLRYTNSSDRTCTMQCRMGRSDKWSPTICEQSRRRWRHNQQIRACVLEWLLLSHFPHFNWKEKKTAQLVMKLRDTWLACKSNNSFDEVGSMVNSIKWNVL